MVFLKYLRQFCDNFKLHQSSYFTLVIINEKSHLKIASILSFFKKKFKHFESFFFRERGSERPLLTGERRQERQFTFEKMNVNGN